MADPATSATPGADAQSLLLKEAIRRQLRASLAHRQATPGELMRATALAVRERLGERVLASRERQRGAKRIHYLSLEFLVGRSLENSLDNLGLLTAARDALSDLGSSLDAVAAVEPDAALGNGGLGRLAACYLDSMATLGLAGTGYGIHYEFGLFRQEIDDGAQRERPDPWRAFGSPWVVERPEEAILVPAYGRVEHGVDRTGHHNPMWLDWRPLIGVPHDFPVVGAGGETVNVLRLYAARASDDFDMAIFNDGDYVKAVEQKIAGETVSKVLYPSDAVDAGRELRLLQEHFLVSCALHDAVRDHLRVRPDLDDFAEHNAIQLNDTHPALAVAELMRILVDEHALPWDRAWEITVASCGYTNHTLMPEALERWPVALLERLLPRHLEIVYEINRRFLDAVEAAYPGDGARRSRMSLVEEGQPRQVRMAHLAIVGSHAVNGVAALHSELVRQVLVPDFAALWPGRFLNVTNGVTPRRWLRTANPGLAALLSEAVGEGWETDLERLRALEPLADDASFRARFRAVKLDNKRRLAALVRAQARVDADPAALFDVQVKRIHEYKRQLLNLLHVVHRYLSIAEDGATPPPRLVLLAGKAAPGYRAAKQIIRLAHDVARVVNADPRCAGRLRLAFLPDYRVTLAETIVPAADLSEQISTAGSEASGTSNMKFALNGALTIGTLDGATVEIRDAVGEENLFLFGMDAAQVRQRRAGSGEAARDALARDPRIRRVIGALAEGRFGPSAAWVRERLVDQPDEWLHVADLGDYLRAQDEADRVWLDPEEWSRRAVATVARMGRFSSDRAVREYAGGVWGVAGY